MAFGLQFGSDNGKLLLTVLRLFAMIGISYYLFWLVKKASPTGLLWCMALILGGAIGNVIDSTFYGVLLDNAPYDAPTPWFHGQVIDMLYFPMVEGYFPDWFPKVGGDPFLFFSPVFNIADSSIFIGVTSIIIFQKRFSISTDGVPQPEEEQEEKVIEMDEMAAEEPTVINEEESPVTETPKPSEEGEETSSDPSKVS